MLAGVLADSKYNSPGPLSTEKPAPRAPFLNTELAPALTGFTTSVPGYRERARPPASSDRGIPEQGGLDAWGSISPPCSSFPLQKCLLMAVKVLPGTYPSTLYNNLPGQ